jgi:hypothetical protein
MQALNRSLRLVAAILLAHALSACGGSDEGATASSQRQRTATSAAASSPTAASKADPEVRFAP